MENRKEDKRRRRMEDRIKGRTEQGMEKEKELDQLLRHALAPAEEPDLLLNRKIVNQVCNGGQRGEEMGKKKRKISAAAAAAAVLIGVGSLSAAAAYRYLTFENVAEETGDEKLAELFSRGEGVRVDETQTYGGYNATLIGIISGEGLSEWTRTYGGEARPDRSYAVVAIRHTDGTPVEDASERGLEETEFFVSPLIGGYDPAFYNAASMHGDYTDVIEGGILYRLAACDNVEIFADHDLYLCVSEGSSFYCGDAYLFDSSTGEISRNEAYPGLNALFRLPLDASDADPAKAAEYIGSLGITVKDIPDEKRKVELEEGFVPEADGNEKGAGAAEYALQFIGTPYVWGGESLTEGCDSSGFTKAVYENFGIGLPHGAAQQKEYGSEIPGLEDAQPGDLVFYEEPSHVAIYIGEGKIVHADPQYGICVSEADYDEITMIRRIVQEGPES